VFCPEVPSTGDKKKYISKEKMYFFLISVWRILNIRMYVKDIKKGIMDAGNGKSSSVVRCIYRVSQNIVTSLYVL
jgi:hypothetical protein